MVHHPDVVSICYGLRHVGGHMAIQGYIEFAEEKHASIVHGLLPDMNVAAMTDLNRDMNTVYHFLKENAVFVKQWWLPTDPNDEADMHFQVEWHHVDPSSNEHFLTSFN